MEITVREKIKKITLNHLKKRKSLILGQCLSAVGWVGGTIPQLTAKEGITELNMADVANGGIVVGAGLSNRRPIYVIRYQGFNWFNAPIILNYACKSKEIWNVPCPIFIRGIAMEGSIGPVAGSSHYSLYYRMPGIKIISPMTPKEYQYSYDNFMKDNDVYYVTEHRGSYDNKNELPDYFPRDPDIVLFAISITRFDAEQARKMLLDRGIKASIIHQLWIKPFIFEDSWKECLNKSKYGGLVMDDDYEQGVASSIAHRMMIQSDKKVHTLGLDHRTAGFHKSVDNLPPSPEKITSKVMEMINV